MRKIKLSDKKLMIIEAGYLYCLRYKLDYDAFIDDILISEGFDCSEYSEFDKICKDLRCYRHYEKYELTEITIEEYELCVDKFGE